MIKCRRRNYQIGGSKAVTYPSDITVGEEATLAGNRLLLIDPLGQIHEDELAEFMQTYVEPAFVKWWQQKEAARRPRVEGVRPLQVKMPEAEEVQSLKMQSVAPGPQVYLVNCWRCGGQIAWQVNRGTKGGCPYCGAWLQLTI